MNDDVKENLDENTETQLTPEIVEQVIVATAQQTADLLLPLAQHLGDEEIMDLAMVCAREQVVSIPQQVLPTLMEDEFCSTHPTFFAVVRKRGAAPEAQAVVSKAAKRLDTVNDPGQALQSAMILGLVLNPVCRAVLRAHGWDITFGQSDAPPPGRIVLAG